MLDRDVAKDVATHVRTGQIVRVCHGVYASGAARCRGTAGGAGHDGRTADGGLHGNSRVPARIRHGAGPAVHVLDPGIRVRPTKGVMVHQRVGCPVARVNGG